jgi:hypothetical protein
MEDTVPFGSRGYFIFLGLLAFGRGMDFLSTWVATPNLVLEGNPIAKKLGWKWGGVLNLVMCFGFAVWPLAAVIVATTSTLVAARNFQGAWLMRLLGEENFRDWHVARLRETRSSVFWPCLVAQTALPAAIGAALVGYSPPTLMPLGIGYGLIIYSVAVAFYTTLSVWRIRRMAG